MRELKFRVWSEDRKMFVMNGMSIDHIQKDAAESLELPIIIATEKCIWQQYTGLKDKSGKEIYEGDIIIFDNSEIGGHIYEGVVAWNDDQCLDNLCWGLWTKNKGWLHCDFLGIIEVIGNIYDNVELLNESNS